jgi:hypothetical protein
LPLAQLRFFRSTTVGAKFDEEKQNRLLKRANGFDRKDAADAVFPVEIFVLERFCLRWSSKYFWRKNTL